jgi:hypothetical protein
LGKVEAILVYSGKNYLPGMRKLLIATTIVIQCCFLLDAPKANAFDPSKNLPPETNIKGIDPKKLPFNQIIKIDGGKEVTKVLFDRAIKGISCFMSCDFYYGVTSKWTDYEVNLQPFESNCLMSVFGRCKHHDYPLPSQSITLITGGNHHKLKMTNPDTLGYYLPLDARKDIASTATELIIEIEGVKMPAYKIGKDNIVKIQEVINQTDELEKIKLLRPSTKASRLEELKQLLDAKQITISEYEASRKAILID